MENSMPSLINEISAGRAPQSIFVVGDVRVGTDEFKTLHCGAHDDRLVPLRVNMGSLGNGGVEHSCPCPGCHTFVIIGSTPDWSESDLPVWVENQADPETV